MKTVLYPFRPDEPIVALVRDFLIISPHIAGAGSSGYPQQRALFGRTWRASPRARRCAMSALFPGAERTCREPQRRPRGVPGTIGDTI